MNIVTANPARSSAVPHPDAVHGRQAVRRLTPSWQILLVGLALFLLALVPRLIGLEQHLTADDQDWIRRAIRFGRAVERGDLAGTYVSSHPAVSLLWLTSLAIGPDRLAELSVQAGNVAVLEKMPSYLGALFDARRALAVASAVLTAVLGLLTWRLFGSGPALLASLLLAFEPFLVAHGRLLHADPLQAQLMAVSLLAALIFFDDRGGPAYLVASGLATGLAVVTKAPAVFLFGFVPLLGLVWTWRRERQLGPVELRRLALQLALWVLAAAMACVLLWPALWANPSGTLSRMALALRGAADAPRVWGNFFLGRAFREEDVGPLFYPVVTLLRLSPITLVGLMMLAYPGLRRSRPAFWPAAACLLAYVALFTLMMTLSPRKVDRFLLPVFPPLAILGALGLWVATRSAMQRRGGPAIYGVARLRTAALTTVALGLGLGQVALLASVHPYPLSFFNPVLGGSGLASRAVIVGWGEGTDQVAAFLDRQPNAPEIVVSTLYSDLIHPLYRGTAVGLEDWQRADYLANYINMEQRGLVPTPLQELVRTETPVFTAHINGLDYARVFRIPPELRAQGGSSGAPRRSGVPVR